MTAAYRTVEQMAALLDKPLTMDLGAVIRLGDFALDEKLVDVPTVPPPEDCIESALPYVRYARIMGQLDRIGEASQRLGHGDLSLDHLVEVAIGMFGDNRGWLGGKDKSAGGREIQLQRELENQLSWLEDAEATKPLSDCGTIIRREIGWASQRFTHGILSFAPDARRFGSTAASLATMCRIMDLPIIGYPDGIELFRCERQDVETSFIAWRVSVHGIMTLAAMFMRSALPEVMEQSDSLQAHGIPGMTRLERSLGFSIPQLS